MFAVTQNLGRSLLKSFMFVALMSTLAACGNGHKNLTSSESQNAPSISLAGKNFCETETSGGLPGQPVSQRKHCINFIDDKKVVDDCNTFFGNPPEQGIYEVKGQVVTLTLTSRVTGSKHDEIYSLSKDGLTITADAGAVFKLVIKIDLAGKKFCRNVKSDGLNGRPAGLRRHCINFIDDKKVVDDGSTFFGNPPESGTYMVEDRTITLVLTGVTGTSHSEKYTLSADGKSIKGEAGAVLNLEN